MKNILFYYSQLNIGGAEKSLIRLMNAFATAGNNVVYLGRYGDGIGEYMLDKNVQRYSLSKPFTSYRGVRRLVGMAHAFLLRKFRLVSLPKKLGHFDIAFIGLQGLSPDVIVNNFDCSKIAIFIRTDLYRIKDQTRVIEILHSYIEKIDFFICVAESVRDSLIKVIPEAEDKAIVIYNILDVKRMKSNLDAAVNPFSLNLNSDIFKIVTVCRISDASKAIFRMVRVCRRLAEMGHKFLWYIVGDGPDLPKLRDVIKNNGLEGIMVTPGRVDNPFGYYRECDLVAMLSYYEGLCGVVNEAKIAGKAIIATEVSGIHEQLEHNVNGWIVDNDEEAILEGMNHLLSNQEVVKRLTNNIYPEALTDDECKVQRLYDLIGL